MKMKKRTFTVLAASCLLACVSPLAWGKAEVTLKLGHIANEQHSWHKGSLKFAEEVAKLTDGRIEVQVFPNDSLGKEIDLINGISSAQLI